MIGKPTYLGTSLREGYKNRLSHFFTQLKRKWARFCYPHAINFNMRIEEFNAWYCDRYAWTLDNIPDAKRNVWLESDILTYVDKYTMPEHWVQGSLRFRKEEDRVVFMLRWS